MEDADQVIDAVVSASQVLVGIAIQSLDAAPAEDVTLTQYRALTVLATQGQQRAIDLASALGVSPSTATRMCDRLVRKELIERRRLPDDRRTVRVALTDTGRELVTDVTQRRRDKTAEILHHMSTQRREQLVTALDAFTRASRS